jgi:hypothetical protein
MIGGAVPEKGVEFAVLTGKVDAVDKTRKPRDFIIYKIRRNMETKTQMQ